MLMHRQPDNVWRLDYQLHDGEDADDMIRPERVVPRVKAHLSMLGIDRPWRLLWTSSYRAFALSLDSYVHGRVLFAGDAAHLVPIFGVRGLNSGFDDAFNLAWKLALVIGGRSPPRLLQSYSEERHLAWRTNIAHAMKSTEFMAPSSGGFKLMRDAVLSLAGDFPGLRSLINPRQSSVIAYAGSPISTVSSDEPTFAAGPKPGEVVWECRLLDAGRQVTFLTRQLGKYFSLIMFGNCANDPAGDAVADFAALDPAVTVIRIRPSSTEAPAVGDALTDIGSRFQTLFDAAPGTVYLVRPDDHVCARWRSFDPVAIRSALERATGMCPSTAPAPVEQRAATVPAGWNADQRDDVYTRLCTALTEAGTIQDRAGHDTPTELFLSRLCLLLIERMADADAARSALADARLPDRAG